MTSYMVFNPSSPFRAYSGRTRTGAARHVRSAPERMPALHMKDDFLQAVKNPVARNKVLPHTSPIRLTSMAIQSVKRFEYEIPDHILQAWPLVHKVHSQCPEPPHSEPEQLTVRTRRRTRNSQGVYRSSVLTPGELEFMVRKSEARSQSSPGQCQMSRSCTEFIEGGMTFVTQEDSNYGGSEPVCGQYSRKTTESQANRRIIPSKIQVTLEGHSWQEVPHRAMPRQDPQPGQGDAAVVDDNYISPLPTPSLLGREKATRKQVQQWGTYERRQREQRRKEQQFILQPTNSLDWYESQGLQTPSVLHKYLKDSFYTKATSSAPAGAKSEVNATALLNYIRDKQKKTSYNPPPPSSGSGEEEEMEDADYQEVHFDTSGVDGYTPCKAVNNKQHSRHIARSHENFASSRPLPTPPQSSSLYVIDRKPLPQGHVRQDQAPYAKPTVPLNRASRGNGKLDLLVSGDHTLGTAVGNLVHTPPTRDHQCTVNGLSQGKVWKMPSLPSTSTTPQQQQQQKPKSHPVPPNNTDALHDMHSKSPKPEVEEQGQEVQEQRQEVQKQAQEVQEQEQEVPKQEVAHNREDGRNVEMDLEEQGDATKRITVVLPNSDTPSKLS